MPTKKTKPEDLLFKQESFWDIASAKEQEQSYLFCEDYKQFLNKAKTEVQVVTEAIRQAKKNGFNEADFGSNLSPQSKKIFFNNKGKSLIMVFIGQAGLDHGAKLLLAHTDSPRLDLKVRPLYEDTGLAYFKPHYYGGIKKYHWPTVPLSLIGTVELEKGEQVEINIGEDKNDPVFLISDLLPHLETDRADKPMKKAIEAEEMNIIIGSKSVKDKKLKDRIKLAVLEWLWQKYNIKEVDLLSADLRFVPSFPARDIGFDASMIGAYGQDDRVCVYTTLQAFLEAKDTTHTKILYLADKEEIGSVGTTSSRSLYLENVIEYLLKNLKSDITVNDFFRKSLAISADVTAAFDPDYKSAYDINNTAHLNHGVVVEKYMGWGGKMMSVDTDPKFIRHIIDLFNKNKIVWQTGHLGKVDQGGGGTVAVHLANRNLEVIDMGVPLLNMHSPYELAAKADIYSAYRGYKTFIES